MENLEIESLLNLLEILPDKVNENLEIDGTKINLIKNNNKFSITVSSEIRDEDFDDMYIYDYEILIKEDIEKFKKSVEALDDCLFVTSVEDMRKSIDIKRFDELLNQDSFCFEEICEVSNMINKSSEIIRKHLRNKINELLYVYNKF